RAGSLLWRLHMNKRRYLICFLVSLATISCNQKSEDFEKRVSHLESKLDSIATHRSASATEIFHLRSECADLGAKILNSSLVGSALTQTQVSRYDPKSNRCYVELTVQTANLKAPTEYYATYLYDGQTGEMLAFAKMEKGAKSGLSFKTSITGYDDVTSYIYDLMRDE
ncbi:MAG: hypothetical protein ABI623_08900, partial [bacterium]